jgi:hypothetical protein
LDRHSCRHREGNVRKASVHFQTPKTTKGRYKSDLPMYGTGGRADWTGIPAATAKATSVKHQFIFKRPK